MIRRVVSRLRARNLALLLILLPVVVSGVYLYALAENRYVSESVVTVKQSGEQLPSLDGLGALIQGGGSGTRGDTLMLRSYIRSGDMLRAIEPQLQLREAFSAPRRDVVFRLDKQASSDEFLGYFRDRVEVIIDDASGLMTIRAQAFSPEQAQKLNQAIVQSSENFINGISQRMARDQMSFADGELTKARVKLEDIKERIFAFQEKHKMMDPMVQAQANTGMAVELQARLSRLEVELKGLQSYMDDNSHQVRALRQQIQATRDQIAAESDRGAGSGRGGERLNALAANFRALTMELHFAEEAFKASTVALQAARVESGRKMKTLVLVESPTLPDESEYPKRAYDLASIALGFLLVFGIVRLLLTTIEDHLD